jgi:hypothetical protein
MVAAIRQWQCEMSASASGEPPMPHRIPSLRTDAVRFAVPIALFLLMCCQSAVAAAGLDDPVEAGRRALRARGDYPWYDEEADSIRRVDVQPPEDAAAHRGSNWQAQTVAPRNYSGGSTFWDVFWVTVKWLLWTLLLVLLIGLVVLLIRAFVRREEQLVIDESDAQSIETRSEADLIESLPFDVKRPDTDLLGEAKRQYAEGNFDEAVIYLFSYQLVQLDQHHQIRLARGKTNRQYLREVRQRPDLLDILESTMVAFEDVFFGRHALSRSRFEECWSRLDNFHQRLDHAGEA